MHLAGMFAAPFAREGQDMLPNVLQRVYTRFMAGIIFL